MTSRCADGDPADHYPSCRATGRSPVRRLCTDARAERIPVLPRYRRNPPAAPLAQDAGGRPVWMPA